MTQLDDLYAVRRERVAPFQFDEAVVRVFPDMIARSVPGYEMTLPLIGLIAARYAQPHSHLYDLGCSLGAATLAMRARVTQPGCRLVAIDSSPAMVAQFEQTLLAQDAVGQPPVTVIEGDIRRQPIVDASVVALNFTLQFIDPADRDGLVRRIWNGLRPGGVLLVSEKVLFADAAQNERFIDIHHDFKRANGYSDLEIAQKRAAIENVLIPETIEQHQQRLYSAGFLTADVWFQALNFMSILAVK